MSYLECYSNYGLTLEPNPEHSRFALDAINRYRIVNVISWIVSWLFVLFGIICLILYYYGRLTNVKVFISGLPVIIAIYHSFDHTLSVFSSLKPISDFIYSFNFKTIVDTYFTNVNIFDISNTKIVAIIGGLILYSYLMTRLKDRNILIKETDTTELKWYKGFENLTFALFSISFLVMCIISFKNERLVELIALLFVFFINPISVLILNWTIEILYDYKSLLIVNTNKTDSFFFDNLTIRNSVQEAGKSAQKWIFIATFLWVLISYIFSFNILTLLLIEITLIAWYYHISFVNYIPNYTVNITLNNETRDVIENAFATLDFPSLGYIEIITEYTQPEEQIKIQKSAIQKITTYTYK